MATKTKTLTFESSLQELEKIIADLERGDQTLEDQLKAFEKGVTMSRDCLKRLDEMERKVQILVENGSGEVTPTDFAE
ncbi:exodeoxyribonuclease VII small subunit [bacterium]|nr:exodeoxyribonuclease VII small subunit [bacterium]